MKAANGFTFIHKIDLHVYFVTWFMQSKMISLHHHFNQTVVVAKYIFNARSKIKYLILNNKGMFSTVF